MAENVQYKELLSTASLETAFTNALQASGFKPSSKASKTSAASATSNTGQYKPQPFQGKYHPPKCTLGINGKTNPEEECWYCKDTGHLIGNCVQLQAHKKFIVAEETKAKAGLN